MKNPIQVLIIFANPMDTSRLRLGTESRIIVESIRLSKNRDRISIHPLHAATIHDVRRALLENEYQIVHISGHGGHEGLLLEDLSGKKSLVPPQALADLFGAYESIECVILNACLSKKQGGLISTNVPYTIAMENSIGDDAAIEFSRGFYDAIGAGHPIEFAYSEGCRTVNLTLPEAKFAPVIIKSPQIQSIDLKQKLNSLKREVDMARNEYHLIKLNHLLGELQTLKYQYEFLEYAHREFAELENFVQESRDAVRERLSVVSTREAQGDFLGVYREVVVLLEMGAPVAIQNGKMVPIMEFYQFISHQLLSAISTKVYERLAQAQSLNNPTMALKILRDVLELVNNDSLLAEDKTKLEPERNILTHEIQRLQNT